jgi:two-component system, OmpR family, phosphate regulon sensor histidine kinase PhoR
MVYFCKVMTRRRINISIFLMLLAIVAIVAFQSYWLRKNYVEEEENLSFRTNVLFRDALQIVQADKLNLDSNASSNFRFRTRYNAVGTLDIMRRRAMGDTLRRKRKAATEVILEKGHVKWFSDSPPPPPGKPDSLATIRVFNSPGRDNKQVIQILRGVESLHDSITVEDLTDRYANLLKEENINLGFLISKRNSPAREDGFFPVEDGPRNEITLGFSKPVTFRVDLDDTTWYIIRKMSSQILISFLLVGLTIFSFILLLRNLIQQRRLTQLKNDFISNITHELKTPIATVSVAIEALRNFNALHDPQRTKEYLDISANELQRLSLLVDKVLKLSMFEKHQIELREESVDLQQLVEEVVSSMKLQFEKYRAKVSIRPEGKDFVIKADRLHVTSVVFNLLDNALKYSKANPAIQIDLKETATDVEMSITDNGIGIAPEFRKRIFDKFFRVPQGDTHNVKGYGLGLSYVAYVIQRHRGTIDMESQPGIGSRFIIKLLKTE